MSNYDDFLHFCKLLENSKKLKIPPPRPWGPFSLISYLCPDFIQMSEFLYLSCPDVRLWWFSSFSQTFRKIEKIGRFPPPRLWGPFSLVSHLCPDFIQMSEFLYLSCPDVKLWWFSSFSQTFRKMEKIEDFPHAGPGDPFRLFPTCAQISSKWVNFYILVVVMSNYDDFLHFRKLFENSKKLKISPTPGPGDPFRSFHTCAQISSKWVNLYILVVLMSNYDDFLHFRKLFEKSKKLEDFPLPGPGEPFRSFHTCAQISSKWVNFYILVVLMSNYDDFLHFRKLFEKSNKLKISPIPALGTLFAHFTLVPRFHPNEWIFIS